MNSAIARRALGGPGSIVEGLTLGTVVRADPLFVRVDDRELGPALLTATASTVTFAVGDQVLVAALDDDTDRIVVIDGMAGSGTSGSGSNHGIGDYAGNFGQVTPTPGYAGRALVTLDSFSTGTSGTAVVLDANNHDFHLHGAGVYAINVSAEISSTTGGTVKGMWLEPNFVDGGWQQLGAQAGVFDLAWDGVASSYAHAVLLIKTIDDLVTINGRFGIEGTLTSATVQVGIDIVKLTADDLFA